MDIDLRLAVVLALVAANGFFAAAEFALVTARKTRIEQLAARGNRAASVVRDAIANPNRFISACQLGITMAGLALGWIAEGTIAALLEPLFALALPAGAAGISAHGVAIPVAFALLTFLLITLGEQVPKMLALHKGEATALLTVPPVMLFGWVFRPFTKLLEGFTNLVLRLMGLRWQPEMHQAYTLEDMKLSLRQGRAAGAPTGDSERLVERALDFAELEAHHVMVPRTEMAAVPADVSLVRLAEVMARHQHSRYPVFEGSSDNIIGVVSAKSLAAALAALPSTVDGFDVRAHTTPPVFIPETMATDRVLAEMKRHRSHLAIVVDEYGVTAGIVTLRDLLDRIAGEVPDETETERQTVEHLPDGSVVVDGLALLSDVDAEIGIGFADSEYDTLGGFIFGKLGRRPSIGDTVVVDDHLLVVEELDGLRVSRVRVSLETSAAGRPEEPRALSS